MLQTMWFSSPPFKCYLKLWQWTCFEIYLNRTYLRENCLQRGLKLDFRRHRHFDFCRAIWPLTCDMISFTLLFKFLGDLSEQYRDYKSGILEWQPEENQLFLNRTLVLVPLPGCWVIMAWNVCVKNFREISYSLEPPNKSSSKFLCILLNGGDKNRMVPGRHFSFHV